MHFPARSKIFRQFSFQNFGSIFGHPYWFNGKKMHLGLAISSICTVVAFPPLGRCKHAVIVTIDFHFGSRVGLFFTTQLLIIPMLTAMFYARISSIWVLLQNCDLYIPLWKYQLQLLFFCFPGFQFLVQLPVISYRYQFFFFSNRNNLLSLRSSLCKLVIPAKGYLNLLNFLILIQQENSHKFWWLSVMFSTKANLLSLFYRMSLGFCLINFIPMDL